MPLETHPDTSPEAAQIIERARAMLDSDEMGPQIDAALQGAADIPAGIAAIVSMVVLGINAAAPMEDGDLQMVLATLVHDFVTTAQQHGMQIAPGDEEKAGRMAAQAFMHGQEQADQVPEGEPQGMPQGPPQQAPDRQSAMMMGG